VARGALAKHLGLAGEPRDIPFAAVGRSGHATTGRDMEELLESEGHGRARRR
jgi:hypothetical protein